MLRLISLIKITRLHNCLMAAIGVWIGGYLVTWQYYSFKIILASISAALVCGAGNALNDFVDIESDKINHPERPFPKGELPLYYAVLVMIIFTLAALGLAFFVSLKFAGIVVIISLLLAAYNFKLKNMPVYGNLVIAFLSGLTFMV
ncbi:MAG: UbiA family prenyltransferase, partial [Candidatus Zixiibacteriota bacterium]